MYINGINNNLDLVTQSLNLNSEQNKITELENIANSDLTQKDDIELKNASKEFETYFLQLMMKEMRKTIDKNDEFIKQSNAEKIFQEELDNEMMRMASQNGSFGLADMLYNQLQKNI